ncbi:MAG: tetratricopeptide repeat protein, partial [Candidatus Tectomicrobia bacterium]
EAGLGKSRLFYEFIQSHRTQGWRVLESASVSYGKATPYFPIIDLLKRYVHVEEGDDARTIRAKLTGQVLTLDEALHDITPALLALCDVLPDDHAFLQLDPPQRRQRTLDGLKRLLLRESQEQPLMLVFEDLHWIDSETQALLDQLVESLPTAALLLLLNYRPEYQHIWGSKTYYTQLRLDLLQPESVEGFLAALLGDDPSLEPLKALLIERTQGNPFFLEEMVRTLVETEVLEGEAGAYRVLGQLPSIQVPDTVQAILAARIDRLSADDKQLLQTAAVIGADIALPLVRAIADLPEDALQQGLAHLQAAEFVYETQLFPERQYTFKHALTHEVAYGSLLQERRRALHARIVEALEALGGEKAAEQVERLAHHALRGEVWDKAYTYYRQAGAKAIKQLANREAVDCFERSLTALQRLPESHDTMAQGIDLRFELRNALLSLGELGRMLDYLQEAERLAEALSDQHRLAWVSCYMTSYFIRTVNYERAVVCGQRALDLTTGDEDRGLQVTTLFLLGTAYFWLGNYERSIAIHRKIVTSLGDDERYERFGLYIFASVASRQNLAKGLVECGAFAEGLAHGEEGLRIAEAAGHLENPPLIYAHAGYIYICKGDLSKAIPLLERGLRFYQEVEVPIAFPIIAAMLGYGYALQGRIGEGLSLLEQAVEQSAAMEVRNWHTTYVTYLSEVYLLADRLQDSIDLLGQALALSRKNKERGTEAYALRLLGAIAARRDPPDTDQAETHYQQSLTLANELGMRPLQAHCHRGLGTLYRQAGQSEQARVELSTAIEMYR